MMGPGGRRGGMVLALAALSIGGGATTGQAQSSFSRGTVTVVDVEPDQVIVSSDSRATMPTGYRDDDCKISEIGGELLFSGAGYRNISSAKPAGTWDAHDVAVKSFGIAKAMRTADTVNATAREWEKETKAFFAGPQGDLKDLMNSGVTKIFDALFVGRTADKRMIAVHDQVKIDPAGPSIAITSELLAPPHVVAVGVEDVANEFINQSSQRAMDEMQKWQPTVSAKEATEQQMLFTQQVVKWTIQYGPDNVGGPVDTATIDEYGIHWIARKNVCKDKP
jgi:hypothetical protein